MLASVAQVVSHTRNRLEGVTLAREQALAPLGAEVDDAQWTRPASMATVAPFITRCAMSRTSRASLRIRCSSFDAI